MNMETFYGRRNAAFEDEEQVPWVAPMDAQGSDVEVDMEDFDVDDPTFVPEEDLSQDEDSEQPSTSRSRRGKH